MLVPRLIAGLIRVLATIVEGLHRAAGATVLLIPARLTALIALTARVRAALATLAVTAATTSAAATTTAPAATALALAAIGLSFALSFTGAIGWSIRGAIVGIARTIAIGCRGFVARRCITRQLIGHRRAAAIGLRSAVLRHATFTAATTAAATTTTTATTTAALALLASLLAALGLLAVGWPVVWAIGLAVHKRIVLTIALRVERFTAVAVLPCVRV